MIQSVILIQKEPVGTEAVQPRTTWNVGNCDVIVSVLVTVGKTIEFYRKNKEEDQVAIVDELEWYSLFF